MSNQRNEKKGLNISAKSFILAIVIIFILMVITYVLTFIIPGGEYGRIIDDSGRTIIDTSAGFKYVQGGIPFWKWILSPFLVLAGEDSITIIAVIAFLLIIGGVFAALNSCGLMNYMIDKIIHKFGHVRYKLMAVLIFFMMAMGSIVGSFEEVVPLVPIITALAIGLGWDVLTGVAMSLLAVGCGFAAGVSNPFTVGVAQSLAGLPMFSGIWLRLLSFALIYILLLLFVRFYAKKIEKPVEDFETKEFSENSNMNKGFLAFIIIVGIGIVAVLSSSLIKAIQDYTLFIMAGMFLVGGISATLIVGSGLKKLGKWFLEGLISIAPSIIMILMASSIKYILVESKILDTILHGAVGASSVMPKAVLILFIYLICLVMNFFIPSGSAKAFLLIPLIVPLAQVFGLSPQLCIVAYAFGDGFSNVFYPTNPALLISLSLADVSYGKWAKYSWKFQGLNFILTCLVLLLGLVVGY